MNLVRNNFILVILFLFFYNCSFDNKTGLWKNKKLFDLYNEASTPWEWHEKLFEHAKEIGITIFSSPFDFTAVDFLEKFSPPVYKIASPEIVDLPLIKKICETNSWFNQGCRYGRYAGWSRLC